MTATWAAVYTKAGKECWTRDNLANQDYDVFLPLYTKPRDKTERPLFRRYLFVDIAGKDIAPIRSTYGACWLVVGVGGDVGIIPTKVIEALQADHAAGIVINSFKGGEFERIEGEVRFKAGPLTGYTGLVSRSEGERVTVLLDIIGRNVHVFQASQSLEPAPR